MTRQTFFYLLVLLVFSSCSIDSEISSLKISPVLIDSNINIRAIEIKNNKVYSATSNGSILHFDIDKSDVIFCGVPSEYEELRLNISSNKY